MFGISWPQLGIILLIVILVFGTKKLRSMGRDVGGAINEFKSALGEDKSTASKSDDSPK